MFTFQFLNDKIHNYVKKTIILNFIIQRLNSNTLSSKIYKLSKTNIFFSRFEGTRGEKTNKYFAPKNNDLVVKAFGENLTEDVLEKWIKESDISNDGKVNYHDFLRKMSQNKKKQTENFLYAEM